MRILIAALADYANVTADGKLNLMGVFDTIGAPKFPVILLQSVIAVRLLLDYDDRGHTHSIDLVIANQDGREFGKLEGRVEIPPIPPGGRVTANQILFLQNLKFDRPDKFEVLIRWDGEVKQRLPLDVVAVSTPPKG